MGYKTIINADGTKAVTWVETPQNTHWRECWTKAWYLMPNHSAKMLLELLGSYKIYGPYKTRRRAHWNEETEEWIEVKNPKPTRYCYANNTVYNNMNRGSKPKDPSAARMLEKLGGPHGRTIFKALCIARKIDLKK